MSIQAMGWVLEESKTSGGARLVLLAMANHAKKDGRECYPSIDLIASEANLHRSTVIRALQWLRSHGHIEVLQPSKGRRSTEYRIIMDLNEIQFLKQSRRATDEPSQNGTTTAEPTVASDHVGVASRQPTVASVALEPLNRQEPEGPSEFVPPAWAFDRSRFAESREAMKPTEEAGASDTPPEPSQAVGS